MDGLTLFVPGGIPQDELRVEITDLKKTHGFGKITKIETPSPYRIKPPCPVAQACGACQWQAMDYSHQVRHKTGLVREALESVGGLKRPPVRDCLAAEVPWGYRNKGQFPVGFRKNRLVMGYYREGTHEIIDVPECLIQNTLIDKAFQRLRGLLEKYRIEPYHEKSRSGFVRHVVGRYSAHENKVLIALVLKENKNLPLKSLARDLMEQVPEVKGVLANINPRQTNVILGEKSFLIAGKDHLVEKIGDLRFSIHLPTFFQVNLAQTEKLYGIARDFASVKKGDLVVDAYAGSGTIALSLSKEAREVIGIESNPQAVQDARFNAQLNGIGNCFFEVGSVERVLPEILRQGVRPDVIILDPPRKGCDLQVLETIKRSAVKRVVYVSCNPVTLARDVKILTDSGYNMIQVQPVDMFPQTYHVESVTLLELGSPGEKGSKN